MCSPPKLRILIVAQAKPVLAKEEKQTIGVAQNLVVHWIRCEEPDQKGDIFLNNRGNRGKGEQFGLGHIWSEDNNSVQYVIKFVLGR